MQACGVCHSDVLTKDGIWPGIQYHRIPGHEVAGIIDEVGAGISTWKKGQRVGVGWHGGQDNTGGFARVRPELSITSQFLTGCNAGTSQGS